MSKLYRPWSPLQSFLFPPSPADWLDEGHLVYVVLDVVETLDLRRIDASYQAKDARGTRPYHPRMMTALLLYAYCIGIPSSRRIERATYEDVALRVLAGNEHPDHSRISDFRRVNLKELEALFVQILKLCQKAGLVKLGHVALDGTKVKANASKHKAMSYERMLKSEAELKAEVERLMKQAEHVDGQEDAEFGKARGDELPDELRRRQERLGRIRKAKAELEAEAAAARARELAERKSAARSEDDPEPPKGGGKRAARTQAAAEAANAHAAEKAKKAGQAPPDTAARSKDALPSHQVPTDKEGRPAPKAQRNFTDPDSRIMKRDGAFLQGFNAQAAVDAENQIIVAHALTNQAPDAEHLRPMLNLVKENCGAVPEKLSADAGYWSEDNAAYCEQVGADPYIATGRSKHGERPQEDESKPPATAKERMRRKVKSPEGHAVYARRKAIVEPVFGQMRPYLGAGFLLRGTEKVRAEWSLHCSAHNLRKLFRAQRKAA